MREEWSESPFAVSLSPIGEGGLLPAVSFLDTVGGAQGVLAMNGEYVQECRKEEGTMA